MLLLQELKWVRCNWQPHDQGDTHCKTWLGGQDILETKFVNPQGHLVFLKVFADRAGAKIALVDECFADMENFRKKTYLRVAFFNLYHASPILESRWKIAKFDERRGSLIKSHKTVIRRKGKVIFPR